MALLWLMKLFFDPDDDTCVREVNMQLSTGLYNLSTIEETFKAMSRERTALLDERESFTAEERRMDRELAFVRLRESMQRYLPRVNGQLTAPCCCITEMILPRGSIEPTYLAHYDYGIEHLGRLFYHVAYEKTTFEELTSSQNGLWMHKEVKNAFETGRFVLLPTDEFEDAGLKVQLLSDDTEWLESYIVPGRCWVWRTLQDKTVMLDGRRPDRIYVFFAYAMTMLRAMPRHRRQASNLGIEDWVGWLNRRGKIWPGYGLWMRRSVLKVLATLYGDISDDDLDRLIPLAEGQQRTAYVEPVLNTLCQVVRFPDEIDELSPFDVNAAYFLRVRDLVHEQATWATVAAKVERNRKAPLWKRAVQRIPLEPASRKGSYGEVLQASRHRPTVPRGAQHMAPQEQDYERTSVSHGVDDDAEGRRMQQQRRLHKVAKERARAKTEVTRRDRRYEIMDEDEDEVENAADDRDDDWKPQPSRRPYTQTTHAQTTVPTKEQSGFNKRSIKAPRPNGTNNTEVGNSESSMGQGPMSAITDDDEDEAGPLEGLGTRTRKRSRAAMEMEESDHRTDGTKKKIRMS